jgi:hypothetical protein
MDHPTSFFALHPHACASKNVDARARVSAGARLPAANVPDLFALLPGMWIVLLKFTDY